MARSAALFHNVVPPRSDLDCKAAMYAGAAPVCFVHPIVLHLAMTGLLADVSFMRAGRPSVLASQPDVATLLTWTGRRAAEGGPRIGHFRSADSNRTRTAAMRLPRTCPRVLAVDGRDQESTASCIGPALCGSLVLLHI
eukprot:2681350-Rhodomonas_salina.1